MTSTVVFDLDKVLLAGNAVTLFLRGRLRRAPGRLVPVVAAAPVLALGAAAGRTRPLAARALTRLTGGAPGRRDGGAADGGPPREPDLAALTDAYREALARRPEAAITDAVACLRAHRAAGDRVVVATAAEERLARGVLAALGLGDVDVVGSTASLRPVRSRRLHGEAKVHALVERGYPPPWTAVYTDSASDLPLLAGTGRPVLVNAGPRTVTEVTRVLGRRPQTRTWR